MTLLENLSKISVVNSYNFRKKIYLCTAIAAGVYFLVIFAKKEGEYRKILPFFIIFELFLIENQKKRKILCGYRKILFIFAQ
ncbi:MAG: hypothetical protein E7092_03065 [Bacteroidales bacterium]|nr:hypothetical protein [Bacteroidales bacterium]